MPRPPPEIAPDRARHRRLRDAGRSRGADAGAVALKPADVRALLRLSNELHVSPPDPAVRKQRLLEGLCQLLRADAGVCVVTHSATQGAAGTVVTVVRWRMSEVDADAFAPHYFAATGDHTAARNRAAGPPTTASAPRARPGSGPGSGSGSGPGLAAAEHCVESTVAVAGARLRACVALFRRQSGRRPFSAREGSMLDALHSESAWLYRLDFPLVSPAGLSLTPRQRQTLQLLLAGHSEKQIAAQLGLSPNTVHHYVKAIHRHFRVSSRSELLARWVST
jgi:DNA-binding CsgD family transcriptional regulator